MVASRQDASWQALRRLWKGEAVTSVSSRTKLDLPYLSQPRIRSQMVRNRAGSHDA